MLRYTPTKLKRVFLSLVRAHQIGYLWHSQRLSGILNTTRTALGRSLLRTWLLRPSTSLEVIQARHDAVECFLLPENSPAVDALQSHLKGITNIPRTLAALKSGKGTTNDWQALVKVVFFPSLLEFHFFMAGSLHIILPCYVTHCQNYIGAEMLKS